MLLSAGYGVGAPYRHSLFRSLMTSVGLIALASAPTSTRCECCWPSSAGSG